MNLREAHGYTYGASSQIHVSSRRRAVPGGNRRADRRHRAGGRRDLQGDARHDATTPMTRRGAGAGQGCADATRCRARSRPDRQRRRQLLERVTSTTSGSTTTRTYAEQVNAVTGRSGAGGGEELSGRGPHGRRGGGRSREDRSRELRQAQPWEREVENPSDPARRTRPSSRDLYNLRLEQSDMPVAHPRAPGTVVVHRRSHRQHAARSACRSFEAGLRNVELYAKAEWSNPGGSVKDRPAARMIADGERRALLTPEKILLDATSGNTGIAYAMIGAARGYRVRLCVPENVTPERKRMLHAYGAEIVFTDPMDGSDGAIREARRLYAAEPGPVFLSRPVQQPRELACALRHDRRRRSSSRPSGRLTHFVAGLGTSGTFIGVGRRLREAKPADQADFGAAGFAASRPRGAEAHGDGHRAGHLRSGAGGRGHRRVSTEEAFDLTRGGSREAGPVRRHFERRQPGRRAEGGAAGARCGDRRDLSATAERNTCPSASGTSRRGPELMALMLAPAVDAAIRAHGVGDVSERVLRGADRPRRRRDGRLRAAEHHGRRAAPPVPGAPAGLPRRRAAGDAVGGELLGFYHSHPDHPARPSQYDLDHAWPFFSYVIVSVREGVPEEMTVVAPARRPLGLRPGRLDSYYAQHDSHPHAAATVHRQAGVRRGRRRHRWRAARRPDDEVRRV